jgi:broad specificity phosphatase PhoE
MDVKALFGKKEAMSILWVRHGESGDNAGLPAVALGVSELTEEGWRQAEAFAAGLKEAPGVLVHSPFVRSRQTAEAVLRRFPETPVEIWPIEEITILGLRHFQNSSWRCRMEASDAYWNRCCPEERESEGAETFVEFIQRAGAMTERALKHPARSLLLVSHGHFLRGIMWSSLHWKRPVNSQAMGEFRSSMSEMAVGHLSRWGLRWDEGKQCPVLSGTADLSQEHTLAGNEA